MHDIEQISVFDRLTLFCLYDEKSDGIYRNVQYVQYILEREKRGR